MIRSLLSFAALLTALFVPPAAAQSIYLSDQEVAAFLKPVVEAFDAAGSRGMIIVVNGQRQVAGRGFGGVSATGTVMPMGSVTEVVTALLALDMVAMGAFELDAPLADELPQLDLPEPASGPITLRHALAHASGLAALDENLTSRLRPVPQMSNAAINRRLLSVRPPGAIAAPDPIGYGLVGLALETKRTLPLEVIASRRLFLPLGMGASFIGPPPADLIPGCGAGDNPAHCLGAAPLTLAKGATGLWSTGTDMARLIAMLMKDGEADGSPIVARQAVEQMTDMNALRLHPLLPGASLGLFEYDVAGRRAIGTDGPMTAGRILLRIFPGSDIALLVVLFSEDPAAAAADAGDLAIAFTKNFIPPTSEWPLTYLNPLEAKGMTAVDAPRSLKGFYTPLPERPDRLFDRAFLWSLQSVNLMALGQDRLSAIGTPFSRLGPLRYNADGDSQLADAVTETLTFARTPWGMVMVENDDPRRLWKRGNMMMDPTLVVQPIPWAILMLGTTLFYLLPRYGVYERRLAGFALGGLLLFLGGMVLEFTYYDTAYLEAGRTSAFVAWRVLFNLGLMSFVAVPLAALSLARHQPEPDFFSARLQNVHAGMVAVAALYFVMLAIFWGVAGEFVPATSY